MQVHVSPLGRVHGVDGILDTPALRLAVLPPSLIPEQDFCGWNLDSVPEP